MFLQRQLVRRAFLRTPRRWAHSPPNLSGLNSVTEEDLAHFAKILPSTAILSTLSPSATPSAELEPFNNDWMNKYHGKSTTVLKPRTVEEVSEIVKWCNQRKIGIVPQGGNTGLVGGGVPVQDELILSLSNMTKVRSFDDVSGAHNSSTLFGEAHKGYLRNSCCGCWVYPPVLVRLPDAPPSYRSTGPWGKGKVSHKQPIPSVRSFSF